MKQKRLKTALASLLVLSMFFSAHSIAFAAESEDVTASTEQTNDTTPSTSVPDKTDATEATDSTSNSDVIANNSNIPQSDDENINTATENAETVITPLTANAITGNCGATENDHVTWTLEQNNEDNNNPTYTLTISGNGAIADYTTNAGNASATQPWKSYKNDITKIVIENNVSRIGNLHSMD